MINKLKKVVKKILGKESPADLSKRKYMTCGNSLLTGNFYLNCPLPVEGKKYLTIGDDSMVGGAYSFEAGTGEVTVGNRVYIAGGNFICTNKIEVEDDVFISWGCYFFDNDSHSLDYHHRLDDMQRHLADWRNGLSNHNTTKDWTYVKSRPIKICRYAWIGMECKILKGVTIGEGAIVGSGSVVTKDVPAWSVVGGNPAVVLKMLPEEQRAKPI